MTIAEFRRSRNLSYYQISNMAGVPLHVPFLMEIGGRVHLAEERKVIMVYRKLRELRG